MLKNIYTTIPDNIQDEIRKRILVANPIRVFIFGSHASGKSNKDSDIDLLVVVNKDGLPKNYKEKSKNYLEISRLLRDLNKKIPLDIVVLTKGEWDRFVEINSSFYNEIKLNGKMLI